MTDTRRPASGRWPSWPPSRQTRGLFILAALGLGAGFVLAQPSSPLPLTAVAGALLAFGVPGIASTRALFPGNSMGRAERVALILGIQLSLVVMCGFLLHLLRPGLSTASWGSLLADVTLLACAVAWVRGRFLEPAAPVATGSGSRPDAGLAVALSGATTSQMAMLVGAGLLVALSLVVARAGVAAQPQPAWTALSIVAVDGGRGVGVGITNSEGQPETYRIAVTIDGTPLTTVEALSLQDGASVTLPVPLPAAGAFLREVGVSLWRSGDPPDGDPYRSVRLTLRGVPGP